MAEVAGEALPKETLAEIYTLVAMDIRMALPGVFHFLAVSACVPVCLCCVVASKLYGIDATIIKFVFVLYCIVLLFAGVMLCVWVMLFAWLVVLCFVL